MKYCNLTLSLLLIGQCSSTRASGWPLSTVLQLLPWVSHELLFTDLRYLVAILRLSCLIPRNYRTLALVRFDDTMIPGFITRLRLQQSEPATAQATQAVVTRRPRGGGSHFSHQSLQLEMGLTPGSGLFCSNKICGFCLQHSFFTQDILRMTGGLLFREKRKKN